MRDKIKFILLNLLYAVIIAIPFIIINFKVFSKSGQPNLLQTLSSILLILIWFAYSFVMGRKKKYSYIAVILIFWGIGLVLFLLGNYIESLILLTLPAIFLVIGPLYSIKYFFENPDNFTLSITCILIALIASLLAFLLGRILAKSK